MKRIFQLRNLPYAGAIVQSIMFTIAGNVFFPFLGWLVGFGVGAIVNYSIAVASSRVSDIAKNRKFLAYLSLVCLLCLSPVIICSTLGWSVATFSWAIASDLSILLTGSIAGKSLISAEPPQKSAERKSARKKIRSAKIACNNAGAGCERIFVTQNSANAHSRTCKYKPTISMPKEEKIKHAG